jgi:hypothetical protein
VEQERAHNSRLDTQKFRKPLRDADPRSFYFGFSQRLRIAQPGTPHTTHVGQGSNCDPEPGLYLEKELTDIKSKELVALNLCLP